MPASCQRRSQQVVAMSSSVHTHPLNAVSGCKLPTVLCTKHLYMPPFFFLLSSSPLPSLLHPPSHLSSSSFSLPHNLAIPMMLMETTFSSFSAYKEAVSKKKRLLALPQHQPCWVHSAPNNQKESNHTYNIPIFLSPSF